MRGDPSTIEGAAPLLGGRKASHEPDTPPVRTAGDAARMVWDESKRLWGIGLPIAVGMLSMYAISSITQMFIGHLGNLPLAAASIGICMNINGWEGMIFIGLDAAISVRVSNELGSGRPRAAWNAVMVVVSEALLIGIVCMALILIFRDSFSIIFTSDATLQRAVAKIAGLLGLTMVLNSVQPVVSGVAVGGGWQGLVAYINLGCYYIFGLPLGYLLGYKFNFGVGGIWSGMLCGITLQTIILLVVIWRTDWKAEAAQALSRVQKWGGKGTDKVKPLLQ